MIPAMISPANRFVGSGLLLLAGITAIVAPVHLTAVEIPGPVTRPSARISAIATTQEVDPVIERIRDQGLNHSQVMATLDTLCNVIGPRLTASPAQVRASDWTARPTGALGIGRCASGTVGKIRARVVREALRGGLETVQPTTVVLVAVPKAWSPGIDGPVDADVVDSTRSAPDLEKYRGKLRGKVVLLGLPRTITAHFEPLARRMDDAELSKLADARSGSGHWRRRADACRHRADSGADQGAGVKCGTAGQSTAYLGRLRVWPAEFRRPTALALASRKRHCWCWTPAIKEIGGTVYVAQAACRGLASASVTRASTTGADH